MAAPSATASAVRRLHRRIPTWKSAITPILPSRPAEPRTPRAVHSPHGYRSDILSGFRSVLHGVGPVIRVAAISDLHIRHGQRSWPRLINGIDHRADLLVLAGDITDNGFLSEAETAVSALAMVDIPVVAVLGNHDRRGMRRRALRQRFEQAGIQVLEGESTVITSAGRRIGIAGVSGSGGGFWSEEDERLLRLRAYRALALRARREAERLDRALAGLEADIRIAVTHFSPTPTTLGSEPLAKYWMLGNTELARVIDAHHVDLVIHGHAHLGNPQGQTPGGAIVRNAALPVNGGVVVIELGGQFAADARPLVAVR
jgi:Icc-related predicted phosphoesterase